MFNNAFFTGEAQYVNDIPSLPGELHGALVLTNVAKGELGKVDASEALVSVYLLVACS